MMKLSIFPHANAQLKYSHLIVAECLCVRKTYKKQRKKKHYRAKQFLIKTEWQTNIFTLQLSFKLNVSYLHKSLAFFHSGLHLLNNLKKNKFKIEDIIFVWRWIHTKAEWVYRIRHRHANHRLAQHIHSANRFMVHLKNQLEHQGKWQQH